jgi:hypothetical protein
MRAIALAVLLGFQASLSLGSPTSIGVFFDAEATDCDMAAEPFTPFNVYLTAILGSDAASAGIIDASFRVDGLFDIQWSVTPNPAADLSLGTPTNGAYIAFPCMQGAGAQHTVLLYTVLCIPQAPVSPRVVRVEPHVQPCDGYWCRNGPSVALCDAPIFTRMLVQKGRARINSGPCTVGVQPESWARVKSLYRG